MNILEVTKIQHVAFDTVNLVKLPFSRLRQNKELDFPINVVKEQPKYQSKDSTKI